MRVAIFVKNGVIEDMRADGEVDYLIVDRDAGESNIGHCSPAHPSLLDRWFAKARNAN